METVSHGSLDQQKAAKGFAGAFAPKSKLALFLRNQVTKAFHVPFVANRALGSGLQDNIELLDYANSGKR